MVELVVGIVAGVLFLGTLAFVAWAVLTYR